MKSTIKVLVLSLSLIICAMIFPKQTSAQHANVSFQLFYDQLSPYGQWVNNPHYGYVWIPDVGSDFAPYSTAGHWILTDYGWTWVSDYDWGWAPFHYGRWDYDNNYGWFWAPDTDWGPAWVSWRRANGYYGWEPMRPGISINLSFGRPYDSYNDHWTYVRYRDFDRPNVNRYSVNRTYHNWLFRNSTVINNTYVDRNRHTTYVSGPNRMDVQKVTGRKFSPVTIRDNNRPGQNLKNGQLGVYRPLIQKNNVSGQRPAPARIVNLNDVKRPSERKATIQPRNANSSQNNKREQQSKALNPQNRNNIGRPDQPQNARPAQPQNARPAQPQNARPAQPQNARPAQPQNARPTQPQNARPAQPQNARPAQPQNARPTQPQNARPAQPQNARPAQPQNARPTQPQNARPAQPQNARPTQPQNARPTQPQNARPTQPQNARPTQQKNENASPNNKRER